MTTPTATRRTYTISYTAAGTSAHSSTITSAKITASLTATITKQSQQQSIGPAEAKIAPTEHQQLGRTATADGCTALSSQRRTSWTPATEKNGKPFTSRGRPPQKKIGNPFVSRTHSNGCHLGCHLECHRGCNLGCWVDGGIHRCHQGC